jgi:hypothetical protein
VPRRTKCSTRPRITASPPSPTSSGRSSRCSSRASLATAITRRPRPSTAPATEEVAVLPASFDLARQGRRDRRQDAGHMRLLLGL